MLDTSLAAKDPIIVLPLESVWAKPKASYPIIMLSVPVVKLSPARDPIVTFLVPPTIAPPAAYPRAVLSLAVEASRAVLPIAEFLTHVTLAYIQLEPTATLCVVVTDVKFCDPKAAYPIAVL